MLSPCLILINPSWSVAIRINTLYSQWYRWRKKGGYTWIFRIFFFRFLILPLWVAVENRLEVFEVTHVIMNVNGVAGVGGCLGDSFSVLVLFLGRWCVEIICVPGCAHAPPFHPPRLSKGRTRSLALSLCLLGVLISACRWPTEMSRYILLVILSSWLSALDIYLCPLWGDGKGREGGHEFSLSLLSRT